ncbi:MAG: hypothetical protein ACO3F7_03480 [Luteolibacter sp.]
MPSHKVATLQFSALQSRRLLNRLAIVSLMLTSATAFATPEKSSPLKGIEIAEQANAHCLTQSTENGLRVLMINDSMGMAGLGPIIDECFRSCPGIGPVHTIMACGTNPLSWMKAAPYRKATTHCGFWSIETVEGKKKPRQIENYYGAKKGMRPKPHTIPKIEDLIPAIKPDILIIQNGNNFFGTFKKGNEVNAARNGPVIRAHVNPMIQWLTKNATSVKRLYWITPPQAGNVSPEVQAFIHDIIAECVGPYGVTIDSRQITKYPYKGQAKDKMHFSGKAAHDWGRDTFRIIAEDLSRIDIANMPPITAGPNSQATPETDDNEGQITPVCLKVRLKTASSIPNRKSFAPYGECMVAYLYDVIEVMSGEYDSKELLVYHPAYIKNAKQDLSKFRKNKELELSVTELKDESLWATVTQNDEVGAADHTPYILCEDVNRHPNSEDCADCNP